MNKFKGVVARSKNNIQCEFQLSYLSERLIHKRCKTECSLSKSPTKTIRTQCNHLFAAIAFCKLELLKVKTAMNHFAIKQKLLFKANQIMLQELRELKAAA